MHTRKLQLTLLILLAASLITTAAYANMGKDQLKDEVQIPAQEGTDKEVQIPVNEKTGDVSDPQSKRETSDKSLAQILAERNMPAMIPDLKIVVDKTDNILTLYSGDTALKSYHAAIGEGGLGDKERSGDHKTPEGTFYISEKLVLSPADQFVGTRWMRVSYPNIEDAQRGLETGLIDQAIYDEIVQANQNGTTPPQKTSLGGGVGIHGGDGYPGNQGNYWTWGCVGLTDKDAEEIYEYIQVGTPLIIQK